MVTRELARKFKRAAINVLHEARFASFSNGLCFALSEHGCEEAYKLVEMFFNRDLVYDSTDSTYRDNRATFGMAGDYNNGRLTALAFIATMPVADIQEILNAQQDQVLASS